jgi:hypothetical protein
MRRRDPAKAVEFIDYLLTYYADGLHWRHPDPQGNLSLPEALHYLRRRHSLKRDGTGYFIQDAMPRRTDLASFDSACRNFGELRAVIELARAMALLEWRKRRAIDRQRANIEVERRP